MLKVYLIKLAIHIPILRSYAWRKYAEILANMFIDSINDAEEVKNAELPDLALYELFPEMKVLQYTMALLPAVMITYYVGEITGDKDWIKSLYTRDTSGVK